MKRDLKKWLKSNDVKEFLKEDLETGEDYTDNMRCENLVMNNEYNGSSDLKAEELVQFIWCSGQKQFLKDILDDIDDMIDTIFNGKDQVKGDKARHVAEEAQLKAWLYNKYKYLQRKNGK